MQQKEIREDMLDKATKMYMDELEKVQAVGDNQNVPPGTFERICSAFGNPIGLNKHSIYYHYRKLMAKKKLTEATPPDVITLTVTTDSTFLVNDDPVQIMSDISSNTGGKKRRNKEGRPPKSSTNKNSYSIKKRNKHNKKLEHAKFIAATKYKEMRANKKN
jgi:hypothetical protein